MAKVLMLVFIALLVGSAISASTRRTSSNDRSASPTGSCGRHGDPCVSASQCCANMRCHMFAHRCQVIITTEEILAQREKILGRRGPDQ